MLAMKSGKSNVSTSLSETNLDKWLKIGFSDLVLAFGSQPLNYSTTDNCEDSSISR